MFAWELGLRGVWGLRPQLGVPPLHPVLSLVTLAILRSYTQSLHHSQERCLLLRMVRVLAAHRAAKTRSLRKVQDLSIVTMLQNSFR